MSVPFYRVFACERIRDRLRFALVTFAHYQDRKRNKKKMIMMIVKKKTGI